MKRLLCILNNMNMGGAETFLMKIYRTLDTSVYQMDFCVSVQDKCDYEDEIINKGGKIFRVPGKTQDSKAFKKQLSDIIRENHYQNVLRITSNAAGFWDLKIAKKAGAAHTIARSSNASDGSAMQRVIHRVCSVLWSKYVDDRIAPSVLAAEYTFGKRKTANGGVHFLHNGLDLDVYRFTRQGRDSVRRELGASPETVLMGHVGRFNTQKNHAFLLQVFYEYLKVNENALLVLTGCGTLENQIREQIRRLDIEQKVILTGVRKDIPDLLSAFDIFLLPSLYEGMPNTAIEAQACGLPCIISDTVTREADLSGKAAFLPIDNPALWVTQAKMLLQGGRISADMTGYDIHQVSKAFSEICYGF